MDSFELSTDTYDPSVLRQPRKNPASGHTSTESSTPRASLSDKSKNKSYTSRESSSTRQQTASSRQARVKNDRKEYHPLRLFTIFRDRRFKIFAGILLILISCYMLIASLSFLSSGADDQSFVTSVAMDNAAPRASEIGNAAGIFGAYLSNLIVSKWFGLGAFVLIFYFGALGISLVGLHKFKFWTLSFRSLFVTIAMSVLAGFVTYNTGSIHYWGGEHGYYINQWLDIYTGIWGTLAVNILLVAVVVLMFFSQVKAIFRFIHTKIAAQKQRISEMNARHIARAEENRRRQAEREAAQNKLQPDVVENNELTDIADSIPDNEDEQLEPVDVFTAATPAEESEIYDKDFTVDTESTAHSDNDDFTDIEAADKESDQMSAAVTQSEAVTITVTKPEIERADIDSMHSINTQYDHTAELSRYRFPSLELLTERETSENMEDLGEQEANKERIIRTLNSYGVEIASIQAIVGPTVTLYEIVPAEGVKIAKIKHLGDDMALSLAALGIRIIAPMPGRGTIGMEVPNRDPQIVSMRSIISSKAYSETKATLPLAMGTTIQGEIYIADLAKIPHLLVAGATGMGKSVGLNAIITSLLYKKHPSELKFVLIDPKMVEFSLYSKLERHYLAKLPDEEEPIITEPSKAVATLNSLCVEMQNRLALLKKAGMRNISEYNKLFSNRKLNPEKGHRYLPYIVVIIDEFADLLMTTGKELETPVARLAQKARAVGIHLILATQRPSVDVITGMIKNNFPGRVAFRVTQAVDSRTILDRPGAEQLVGRGDMLFSQDGKIQRVQCAFIDTDEVESICDSIAEQIGYSTAYELPDYVPASESATGNMGAVTDRDPLFADAARTIIESGTGSTSLLQRKYTIGYPRAGKIMDQLEMAGVVGPAQGGKPRQVLMDIMAFESMVQQ